MDSGLIQARKIRDGELKNPFQSLFQWIPVLYVTVIGGSLYQNVCFNPYFSGFRSYTPFFCQYIASYNGVSILISVDSGLILYIFNCWFSYPPMFQSLFQWIPVLYTAIILLVLFAYHQFQSLFQWIPVLYKGTEQTTRRQKKFQSLFQWIPVLYREGCNSPHCKRACFNPYFSGFRSYTNRYRTYDKGNATFQSLFQWIPVLY